MALRARHEAGEIDTVEVRRRLGELARSLLARHPRDPELVHVTRSLATRGFVPAPPATLPEGKPAEVRRALMRRAPADLEALAGALVVTPDASDSALALAALELFLLVPAEASRAQSSIAALEARGHDVSLARFELAARAAAGDREALAKALADVSEAARPEANRRAAAKAIDALGQRAPLGLAWLTLVKDRTSIANHALAFSRRPALRAELGPIAEWIEADDPALKAAHEADRQATGPADWARAGELLAEALDGDDRARVAAARAQLLGPASEISAELPAPAYPRSALAARLGTLTRTVENADTNDAAALELLGDRKAAANLWLDLALARDETYALTHATRLAAELSTERRSSLIEKLARPELLDEARLADPDLRSRATLLHLLEPDPWSPIRLAATSAPARSSPIEALADNDPHHPENRLAAASDLLAAGKLEPASNILAALVRKVDEHAPARLFNVVAQALEVEEPVADLIHAAHKALTDERRVTPLLAALRKAPSAAFALHEELIAFALDPSRNDVDRLFALEVWLGIWRATETPPDPDAIRTLRQDEPALLAAAALRLGGQAEPLAALTRFLAEASSDPDAFSAAVLGLSLGR